MAAGRKTMVTILVLCYALTVIRPDSNMKCLQFNGPQCKEARDSGVQSNIDLNCIIREKSCPESADKPCACRLSYLHDLNQSGYDKYNNAPPSNHSFYGLLYADINYHFGRSPECQQKECKVYSNNPLSEVCCCNTHMCNADYHSIRQSNAYVSANTTLLNTTGTTNSTAPAIALKLTQRFNTHADQENHSGKTRAIILSCIAAVCCAVVVMSATIIIAQSKRRSPFSTINTTNRTPNDFNNEHDVVELDLDPTFLPLISYGRYSKIYHGNFEGKKCVFKVTEMNQLSSWNRERYIYELLGLSHSHILKFFGAFKHSSIADQYVLVLEYHGIGSLQAYLKTHTLSWETVLKVSQSMMSGLAHLHDEILLDHGLRKYPIAHRDFKSKNVLLKDDLTACIADFNLASELSNDQFTEYVDKHIMVGTICYMAPELLDSAISFNRDAFLCIDVYAASLVLWEILSRCDLIPISSYHFPYEEELGKDLDVNSLKLLVKGQNQRPAFSQILDNFQGPRRLIAIIKEGWEEEPECRRTARNMEWQIEKLLKKGRRKEIFV